MTNDSAQLRSAATALLSAAEMLEHNEAIFKGKWKKGSKAWSGDFIERTVKDGLGLIGAHGALSPMTYSAAERLEGGKLKMHLAPPPMWDGKVTFDSEFVINGFHVQAGTVWHVVLHKEVK